MAAPVQQADPTVREAPGPTAPPLAGLRVVEFGGFAAGPVIGKHLANYGAEVIRIESRMRLDGFRTHYPPYKDNLPGPERAGIFSFFNDGKRSVTLNLKHPAGVELARRLIGRSDVVIENFTPGTMARLGLDYATLAAAQPGLIMLSTCNQGQTGPHAAHPGFGSHLTALSGFTHLLGFPDRPPVLLYGPYIDYIAVGYGTIAVLAALMARRSTGRGVWIDLSQYEAGLQFMAPALLDWSVNGRVAERSGNREPSAAPHGVYPCQGGEQWVALSVWSDAEWRRLVGVLGEPDWAQAAELSTLSGRRAHEDELDARIAAWTRSRCRDDVVAALRRAGVRVYPVLSMEGVLADPQLRHRRHWRTVEHPVLGPVRVAAPPYTLTATPSEIRDPAPCLGQHTTPVLQEVLELSDEEIQALEASGALA